MNRHGGARRAVRWLGAVGLLGFFLVAFTPMPEVLSQWMTLDPPLERVSAIVVLGGGGVRGDGTLTDISLRRTVKGLALYWEGMAPLLVVSGTKSENSDEATARSQFARACGVEPVSIITDSGARTTHEEATRLASRLLPRGIRKIALVVDAQGTRRAMATFRRVGFTVVPVAANDVDVVLDGQPEGRLVLMRRVLLEATALLYYRLMGYL